MSEDLRRGTKLGPYELLQRIGRGGMATVWVARHHRPEGPRLVAVKAILADLANDQEFINMFLDEGRLVQMIRHPHVVDVYDVAEHSSVMCMAMEWVEGDSLHALIAEAGKRRPIPPEMAVRIIADAAGALHAAHELRGPDGSLLNVVHRDVSPHNILVGTDGAIKLVDFGVAKAMGRLGDATQAGQLKGKFGYMSPEQAQGQAVDRRADVFALGIVLFELTTGRRLFRGEHDAETLHLVVSGKIPLPVDIDPSYPAELQRIVMKVLERDLDKRYQTAKEFEDDLESYLRDNRIIVPRQGLGSLLMRVLGKRIEQRRKAIKSAVKIIDGGPADADGVSSDPGAATTDTVTGVTGSSISGPSTVTGSVLTGPSSVGSVGGATFPQTATQPGRRGGFGGYLVGIAGLAAAVIVLVLYATSKKNSTTTIVTAPAAKPVATQPASTAVAPPPADLDDGAADVPTLDMDAIDPDSVEPEQPGKSRPVGTGGPKKVTPKKDPTKPAPAPKAKGDLPRGNPYK